MTTLNLTKIPITTLDISPGSHLLIPDITWEQYEVLYRDWGEERRVPRLNYCHGTLEIMSPLPAHERPHRIIADIIKTLLDAEDRAWEDFGSTAFKKAPQVGLEPDTCFYIQNAARVRALLRIDLDTDPPPDLAIESDLTSKTTLESYAVLGVPEVWIYDNSCLSIYLLGENGYQRGTISQVFPALDMPRLIPELVQLALSSGTSVMLRNLRRRL
ncbi:MAG: Uma2 family endonuclease [Cyanobacteria bacterium RI_101]|nr:Uma2 family endonuclease [Cyanobacteria bacterium RI_101]